AFLTSVTKDSDWKTVYIDDFMIVLVKNYVSLPVPLETINLAKLDTTSYSFDSYLSYLRLSLFLAQTGNPQSAEKFARAGLLLFGINAKNKFFW
ncbi:MAG: hypothetical protein AAB801_02245, partial [Patescibacteria group bacterium]